MFVCCKQDVSEVCASRIPTKQEDDVGACTAQRINRLGDLARIVEMEISATKAAFETLGKRTRRKKDEVRAMEVSSQRIGEDFTTPWAETWDDTMPEMPTEFQVQWQAKLEKQAAIKFEAATAEVKIVEAELALLEEKMANQQRQPAVVSEKAAQLKFGGRPSGLHPWPLFYPQKRDKDVEVSIVSISTCTLCDFSFPNRDIIVAPCMHIYHPWCAFVVFGKGTRCVLKTCQAAVDRRWHQSFGWGNPTEELLQDAALIDMDGVMSQLMQDREDCVKQHQPVLGMDSSDVFQ